MAAGPAALHHRNAGDAVVAHEREGVRKSCLGADDDRVHHHAGLEFLHLPDFLGLRRRLEVAVDDPDAACLRHGDGEPAPP